MTVRGDERQAGAADGNSEPTNAQLESLAAALGFPVLPEGMRPPYYRESLLNLHGIVQRAVSGDAGAARTLKTLRAAFVRPQDDSQGGGRVG